MQPETLNIDGLAELLHYKREYVKKLSSTAPERLPPKVKLPGSKQPLWLRSTALAWLEQHQEVKGST